MPTPPESEPPKPKEPPEKREAAPSAKLKENPEITKAKEIIEGVTSKDADVRMKTIEKFKLRIPPMGDFEQAKKDLASLTKIDWLDIDKIQHSLEVANYASDIAKAGELAKDPRWLLAKTVELAYGVRSEATADVRREINDTVTKAGVHLMKIMHDNPQLYEGVNETSFDEAMYGGVAGPLVLGGESVINEEKPEDETITDPELIRFLREINKKIRTNPDYLSNPKYIENDIQELQRKANERGVPERQVQEAMTRLIEIKNRLYTEARKEEQARRLRDGGERLINYTDIMGTIPEQDRLEDPSMKHPFDGFRYMSLENIDLITKGLEGQREYFYKFITEIFTMGKSFEHADLPEMQEFKEFQEYMKWAYPKNTDYYFQEYNVMWKELPRHYQAIKNLLFMPGDINDKLKGLRVITGADMDLYAKTIFGGNYAISLYDETIRDLLSERRMKYEEAVNLLKSKDGPRMIEEYKKLLKKHKTGQLGVVDGVDENRRFQELQEMVDLAGYGVMLYDSDIQNYTELDLEVNAMSHELDKLILEQQTKQQKGERLSESEIENMDRLRKEIDYKRKKSQEIRDDDNDLHKTQHEDKGLSPVDREVKRRLRLVLQDRYPDREIKDWELNMAVWAGRQWMMGSSHLVSLSSQMAIRPAFEFKDVIKEVNPGKYIMKAPAFEDIQRVLNPDLFADRFSMGNIAGDIFRAQLDKSLLEEKGHTFKNLREFKRPEENKLDPIVRQTKEFIRQVQAETGLPYTELLIQGDLQTGGNFDGSGWRAEIAAIDEIRKKYLDRQKRGELPADATLDNQALGVQFAMKDERGRKEILERMMARNPSIIMQLLGSPMDDIFNRYGLNNKTDRDKFRRALSIAQIGTWDVHGPRGEKSDWAFKDVNLWENRTHFNTLLDPFLEKEGFNEAQRQGFFTMLGKVHEAMQGKKDIWARTRFPLTIMLSDIDWKDAEMFQIGTIGMDRRARDMGGMAQAKEIELKFSQDPLLLCGKDPKETLKKLKEFRDIIQSYTTGDAAEKATYNRARAWLNFNRNRWIHAEWDSPGFFEDPIGWGKSAARYGPVQVLKLASNWVPPFNIFVPWGMKQMSELDATHGLIPSILSLKVGKDKKYVFGDFGKNAEKWFETTPRKISQNISYAVRFTGPRGNAFEEKELDEILNQMLEMGIFNAEEHLYHQLRREMKASFGYQVARLIRKYWWIAPLAAAFMGAKEGMEEEKKRSGGGGH